MNHSREIQDYALDTGLGRVLLINPSVHDTRFPWSQWQQPVTLLQLATALLERGCDVRLVDALYRDRDARLAKERVKVLERGSTKVNYWRFGLSPRALRARLDHLKQEQWAPDEVIIDGFTTFWWPGVAEAIAQAREVFPKARVVLTGAYARVAPTHAAEHSGADIVVRGTIPEISRAGLHATLYPTRLPFASLSLDGQRSAHDVVAEIEALTRHPHVKMRVRRLVVADVATSDQHLGMFCEVLETLIEKRLKISLHMLGALRARDVAARPELAALLRRAGCRQIVFADDRDLPMTSDAREEFLAQHKEAVARCVAEGFPARQDQLAGTISIGRKGEDLATVTRLLTQMAHVAGSLIPIPYQPSPGEVDSDPDHIIHNGKLFPFAEDNGATYRAYQDLLGLAALLNAKYRQQTFDFLGDGLIASLVRESLVTERWDPRKSDMPSRPITIGYFNKEGKWVRS